MAFSADESQFSGGPYAGGAPHVQYRSPSGEPSLDITPVEALAPPPASAPYVLVPRNGRGNASLVLGCLAVLCTAGLFFLFPLGIIFGLFAVGLGRIGRERASWGGATNRATATAGLTLGAVSLVLGAALTAGTIWVTQNYDVGAIRDCVVDRTSTAQAGHCLINVFDRTTTVE